MNNKKQGVFKRKVYPRAKESTLPEFTTIKQLAVLRTVMRNGSAIVVLGSENSPRKELLSSISKEFVSPTSNGIMVYDANVPYKNQQDRDIIVVSINDCGNSNIIHSIKKLGNERSRTLYAFNPNGEEEVKSGKSTSDRT